jgi:large subunit ribosomal protein L1
MAQAKKATKTKTPKKSIEGALVEEIDITQAALDAAKQEQTLISEKRDVSPASTALLENEQLQSDEIELNDNTAAAKAGKRSNKAQKEAAKQQAKIERKAANHGDTEDTPKTVVIPSRSKLERRGKLYQKSAKLIEESKTYVITEAVSLAKKTSYVKFDATVELHVNLAVDPRHADQNVRDNLVLPAGTGKTIKIAVLTEDAAKATEAGADIAGSDEILQQLEKGNINFDVLIATPSQMAKLGKYARVLGPRGLMPNPKSGTVTTDVVKAVGEAKAGRVEYRVDSSGIVHLGVGKVSFSEADLIQNVQAILLSLTSNKPSSVKGAYIKSIHLTTSMGPSIPIAVVNNP